MIGRLLLSVLAFCISPLLGATTTSPPEFPTSSGQTTCSTLQQIASNNQQCHIDRLTCTHLQCSVEIPGYPAMVDLGVLPCMDPPSISVVITTKNSVVLNRTFSHSAQVPVAYSGLTVLNLNVTLLQSPNEDYITLAVVGIPSSSLNAFGFGPFTIVPETTIPIDRSQCNATFPTPVPTTPSPAPTSTVTPPHPQTCNALEGIASNSDSCRTAESCTALDCDFASLYHSRMIVLPCDNPPAIQVVVTELSSGAVLVNDTVRQSRTFSLAPGADLVVTVRHVPSPDSIIFKVSLNSSFLGEVPVIPETSIPIDRSNCTNLPTPTVLPSPSPSSPPVDKTCQALEQLASSSVTCHTSPSCTTLICDSPVPGTDVQTNLTVLPCERKKPAIKIRSISDGDVVLDDTVSDSRLENVTIGRTTVLQLNVTVKQSPALDGLTLKVDGMTPRGTSFPLVPEQKIPIDRCSCPNITCSSTPASTPGEDHTSANSAGGQSTTDRSTRAESKKPPLWIAAPVVAAVLVVLAAVVLIVVFSIYCHRKKSRAYTFQRMAFSEVEEEEDN